MKEFKTRWRSMSRKPTPDPNCVFGWAAAQTMVEALKGMEEPTRQSLMDRPRLDVKVPILLPGIEVKTSDDDGYPIEAMQIMPSRERTGCCRTR